MLVCRNTQLLDKAKFTGLPLYRSVLTSFFSAKDKKTEASVDSIKLRLENPKHSVYSWIYTISLFNHLYIINPFPNKP